MIHEAYHDKGKRVTRSHDLSDLFTLLSPSDINLKQQDEGETANIGALLSQLGFSKPTIRGWMARARANGSSLDDEILMEDFVDEAAFYGAIARYLRLPFLLTIDATSIHYSADHEKHLVNPRALRIHPKKTAPQILIVPELGRLKSLASALSQQPHLRLNLQVTSRSAMRDAIWQAGASARSRCAITDLSEKQPIDSARTVLLGKQSFILGACIGAATVAMLHPASPILLAIHVFCSGFYFMANALRLLALMPRFRLSWRNSKALPDNTILPIYSVLIPLHREKEIIPQLIRGLDALEWPRSRLDIKLICEADDQETLNALQQNKLGREYQIIRVPPSEPRTKPKALQYTMPSVRGQYLTIYDAEDRPHPQQLREAYRKFYHGPSELSCIQAPLIITNIGQSWISSLFAAEYAALFRRVLPMLSANGLPVPLGGTSNHFKTSVLRQVGGWDPFNVAEDADLGLRISRMGYKTDIMDLPTLEDAPTSIGIWMKQRMRWYKGWLISWLVMMRAPIVTLRQLGLIRFAAAQLIVGGLILASLSHPFVLTYIAVTLYTGLQNGLSHLPAYKLSLLAIDAINILGSYVVFLLLSHSAMTQTERIKLGQFWLLTPIYWLMLAAAAWYSLYELKHDPHRWNKTPHRPSNAADRSD